MKQKKTRFRDKRYPGVCWRIRQKEGKIFYVTWRDETGRQREKKVGTEAEGLTAALVFKMRWKWIREFEGKPGGKRKGPYLFKEAAEAYFEHYEARGGKGVPQERSRLKYLAFLNDRPLNKISNLDLEKIQRNMTKAGKSPTSIHHVLSLLRRILRHAVKNGMVKDLKISFDGAMKKPRKKIERLTAQELQCLIHVLETWPDRFHANIMKVALFSGLRKSEILRLEWRDVNREMKSLHLRDTKSGGDKDIPINTKAAEALEEMRRLHDQEINRLEDLRQKALRAPAARRPEAETAFLLALRRARYAVSMPSNDPRETLRAPVKGSPFIFPGQGGGHRKEIRKGIDKIRKAAELPAGFRPLHGLRHVFGTVAAAEGSAFIARDLLTHSSLEMTKRYVDLGDPVKRDVSEKTARRILNGGA